MELFIYKTETSKVPRKCSLFGDEEIELTKNWYDQQIITGYGSWSKTFSIPIDSNNAEIFNYYDVIGGSLVNYTETTENTLNPNYFLRAQILINDFAIDGNIQVVGFSLKNLQPYAYQVVFFGDEKNLITELNNAQVYLSDIDPTDFEFTFNIINVINSWMGTDKNCFVPIMATKRPFSYTLQSGTTNINASIVGGSGVTMGDLAVAYNFKKILDVSFKNNTFNHSPEVTKILKELYIMPNTKVDFTSEVTFIHVENKFQFPVLTNGQMVMRPTDSTDPLDNGILVGNTDLVSYNNILDWENSTNVYSAQTTGTYKVYLDYDCSAVRWPGYGSPYYRWSDIVFDVHVTGIGGGTVYHITSTQQVGQVNGNIPLTSGDQVTIWAYYNWYWLEQDYYTRHYEQGVFMDGDVDAKLKYQLLELPDYNYSKKTINFPKVLLSEFFINFCKTFNIFFIYDGVTISTYLKDELPVTTYDLSRYNLLDKDYTFNNQQKYKLIDYKFAEPKDINNLAWKQGNDVAKNLDGTTKTSNSLWYGEYRKVYNYDVGIDKLEYKSIFTTFPRTTLNITEQWNNVIIGDTFIPLHSELDQSLAALNTDFLLMYKLKVITGLTSTYYLQNELLSDPDRWVTMTGAADYGPDGPEGYSIDYENLQSIAIKNNTNKVYETTLDFLLPTDILYKIKVYDKIVIRGITFDILDMTMNIRNGYTKMKVQTDVLPTISGIIPGQPATTTSTTRVPCTSTTTTTTQVVQTTTTTLSPTTTTTTVVPTCNFSGGTLVIVTGITTTTTTTTPFTGYTICISLNLEGSSLMSAVTLKQNGTTIYRRPASGQPPINSGSTFLSFCMPNNHKQNGDSFEWIIDYVCTYTGSAMLRMSDLAGTIEAKSSSCPTNSLTISGVTNNGDVLFEAYVYMPGTTTTTTTIANTTTTTQATTTTTTTEPYIPGCDFNGGTITDPVISTTTTTNYIPNCEYNGGTITNPSYTTTTTTEYIPSCEYNGGTITNPIISTTTTTQYIPSCEYNGGSIT